MASPSNFEEKFVHFKIAESDFPCAQKEDSYSIWVEVPQSFIVNTLHCFAFSTEDSHGNPNCYHTTVNEYRCPTCFNSNSGAIL